jgi:DNA-binding transcriptional ArsR family regulator
MQTEKKDSDTVIRRDSRKICPKIYSFHENIPKYKLIRIPKGFDDPPVRPAIMQILRNGIIDDDVQGKKLQRFALNTREIKKQLEEYKDPEIKKISYTNLYFHLNKLLELGAIHIVAMVIERSHRIAYYGRSAYIILKSDPEAELQTYQKMFTEIDKLAKALRPDVKIGDINTISKKYFELKSRRYEDIARWLAKNESIIRDENLDLNLLFKILSILDTLNPEYKTLLTGLNTILPESDLFSFSPSIKNDKVKKLVTQGPHLIK